MTIEQIASAIENDLHSALSGVNSNITISIDQLQDEIISMREIVVKEWWLHGLINRDDLLTALNCVVVDCKDPAKCRACDKPYSGPAGHSELHFEIPKTMEGLDFVGSADRQERYRVYYSPAQVKYNRYRRRHQDRPYVYIEKTPNENGNYDGWIFNLPFVKTISVIGIFKDPRDLEKMGCYGNCDNTNGDLGSVSHEVQSRLTKEKMLYYRQYYMPPQPNNQIPR